MRFFRNCHTGERRTKKILLSEIFVYSWNSARHKSQHAHTRARVDCRVDARARALAVACVCVPRALQASAKDVYVRAAIACGQH